MTLADAIAFSAGDEIEDHLLRGVDPREAPVFARAILRRVGVHQGPHRARHVEHEDDVDALFIGVFALVRVLLIATPRRSVRALVQRHRLLDLHRSLHFHRLFGGGRGFVRGLHGLHSVRLIRRHRNRSP